MYEPGTILALKEPRDDDQDGNEFPYNRVSVIGASPVIHSGIKSEWVGALEQGVVVSPLSSFAANIDEPLGKLQQLYKVESVPEHEIEVQKIVVKTAAQMGPTPEEVFADLAEDSPNEGGRRWVPEDQRVSPIGEDPRPVSGSPLDEQA